MAEAGNQSVSGEEYTPVIPHTKSIAEVTLKAVVIGIFISIVFGAANAYLGLKFGMTVSASIPAAVISMAMLRSSYRMRQSQSSTASIGAATKSPPPSCGFRSGTSWLVARISTNRRGWKCSISSTFWRFRTRL